jgi:hypothetical protein
MTKRFVRWSCTLLAVLPALGALLLIQKYGVNFHFVDEWDPGLAGLFVRVHEHRFTLGDLFVQQNEHRQAVPRMILLLTNPLTHWNNFAVLVMGWLAVCATSLVLLSLIRRTSGRGDARTLFIWLLCNLLLFSPLQYESWLWGVSLGQWLLNLFVILSFWMVGAPIRASIKFPICFLLAVAGTFSLGNGILMWPLMAILFLLAPELSVNSKKGILVAWIGTCAMAVGLYFRHYARPAHAASGAYSASALGILHYNLAFFGAAFAFPADVDTAVTACTIVGTVMLLLLASAAIYYLRAAVQGRRDVCARMLPWFLVALYGILSGFLASLFRAGYGPQQALSSRYVSFAVYIPIALANLVPIVTDDVRIVRPQTDHGRWKKICALSAGAAIALYLLTYPSAMKGASDLRLFRRQGKAMLLLAGILPNDPLLGTEVGAPAEADTDAPVLNEMGYLQPPLIQSNDASQLVARDAGPDAPVYGRLDGSDTRNGLIEVVGWAFNRGTGRLADGVLLTYESPSGKPIIFVAARMNLNRKDVAAVIGDPRYEWSGWTVSFPPSLIPAEVKIARIRAWALDADTAGVYPLANACLMKR